MIAKVVAVVLAGALLAGCFKSDKNLYRREAGAVMAFPLRSTVMCVHNGGLRVTNYTVTEEQELNSGPIYYFAVPGNKSRAEVAFLARGDGRYILRINSESTFYVPARIRKDGWMAVFHPTAAQIRDSANKHGVRVVSSLGGIELSGSVEAQRAMLDEVLDNIDGSRIAPAMICRLS